MSRFLNTRSGLLACGVILGLGFVSATAGVGLAQSALKKRYVGRIPNERVLASLNERVRMHAESLLGSQVGGGECTDLVNEVLRFCNAKQIHIRSDGQYEWGQAIPLYKKEGGLFVIPGDILQFENVELKGGGSSYKYPHHTAIVRSANGKVIELLHQNVNGVRRAVTGSINLDQLQPGGTISTFRPKPL